MRNFVSKFISPEEPSRFLDQLVHESASENPLERARHRFFMLPRLLFAGCALMSAPVWLFLYGPPSSHEALIFLLAQTPLIAVAALARTGRLPVAQSVSVFGWLALSAAFYATAGFTPAAVAALTIALVEVALAPGVAPIFLAEAAAVAAIAAGVDLPGFDGVERSAAFPLFAAPLSLYAAFLALCAVRAEIGWSRGDTTSARDLRLLTGALGDMVLRLDRSGAVAALIGDAHKTYGLDRRDLVGRGFFQRVHIADRPAFLKLVSDAAAQCAPLTAVLRVQVGSAGAASGDYAEPVFNYFEARMRRARPAADETEGEVVGSTDPVVCILRDVTAQTRADEAVAAARAEGERVAAIKERFLANVSHELRTPLNAIIGFSEMLANPALCPADPAKQREYARIVADSGNHLLQVVNTILDMSKIEAGAMQLCPEPFSLPELIDQCCDMMQLKADEGGVRLLRDYGPEAAQVVADKRACKQIMLNLLSNAVKFTPAGGRVGVRVAPEGNLLSLTVADTGIGIAPADLSRLGDPFFQASATHDRAYEGTGLGLSVVRGLVGLHGGAIVVESAPKKGTAVTVRLPLDCRARAPASGAVARIETIPRHGPAFGAVIRHDEETVKKIA